MADSHDVISVVRVQEEHDHILVANGLLIRVTYVQDRLDLDGGQRS